MALRIDLSKNALEYCINLAIASAKRAANTAKPQFKELHEKDMRELHQAILSITEIK